VALTPYYLADTSALARSDRPVVAEKLLPLLEARARRPVLDHRLGGRLLVIQPSGPSRHAQRA
jgi:hypothetical protein